MVEVQFEVEALVAAGDRAFVLARTLTDRHFVVTEASTLAGLPLNKHLDIPRTKDAKGMQRYDLFAFCLRQAQDMALLRVGQQVTLRTPEDAPQA